MKKKNLYTALILLGYCVPYSFLAMYGDATTGTLWLYGLLIVGMGLLCWCSVKIHNPLVLLIGNILSCITSFLCVLSFLIEEWGWYFKPFAATTFVVIISVIAFAVQLMIWVYSAKKHRH